MSLQSSRSFALGRIVLVALLIGILVVSLGMIASAQGLPVQAETETRVDVDVDVQAVVDDAGARVDTALEIPLDSDVDAIVGGLDAGGLLAPGASPDGVAVPESTGHVAEARPLTTQEAAVVGGMAAVAGAGFLFWLKSVLALGGARFLGAPLFSRIEKGELLDNEGREMLMNLVEANPGIGLKELSEQSGLGWGTTVYHASRLEQAGFLVSMKKGQNRHFFKNGHPAARMKESVAVLRNETVGSMARFLLAAPGATQTTIARHLGLGAPTVTKYVKRMEEQGLVEVSAMGRSKIVSPTSDLSIALQHAVPDFNTPAPLGIEFPLAAATVRPVAA